MGHIYFFGDTHGALDIDKIFMPNYAKDDYIIVCGDFGVLWSDEEGAYKLEEMLEIEAELRERIESLPCTLLFIDGNHENFNRLNALKQVDKFQSVVGEYIKDKCYHLKRGHIYNIAGHTLFAMGGALSIDRYRREEFVSWWSQEAISQKEIEVALQNIESFKGRIEIVVSHTCPSSFLKPLSEVRRTEHKKDDENPHKLEKIKNALVSNNQKPRYWIFGHWHSDANFKHDEIEAHCLYFNHLKLGTEGEIEKIDSYYDEIIIIGRKMRGI